MKNIKIISIAVLAGTCILSACATAAFIYTRDDNPEDQMIVSVFGEERAKELVSRYAEFKEIYFFTDGTTCEIRSGQSTRSFESEK